jgi:hypothetical protein
MPVRGQTGGGGGGVGEVEEPDVLGVPLPVQEFSAARATRAATSRARVKNVT